MSSVLSFRRALRRRQGAPRGESCRGPGEPHGRGSAPNWIKVFAGRCSRAAKWAENNCYGNIAAPTDPSGQHLTGRIGPGRPDPESSVRGFGRRNGSARCARELADSERSDAASRRRTRTRLPRSLRREGRARLAAGTAHLSRWLKPSGSYQIVTCDTTLIDHSSVGESKLRRREPVAAPRDGRTTAAKTGNARKCKSD